MRNRSGNVAVEYVLALAVVVGGIAAALSSSSPLVRAFGTLFGQIVERSCGAGALH